MIPWVSKYMKLKHRSVKADGEGGNPDSSFSHSVDIILSP